MNRQLPTLAVILIIAMFAAFAVVPYVLQPYYLGLIVKILILALFAMSLDLMVGYSGMASLGHAAYFGIAAYTAGLLALKLGLNLWLAMPAALILAGTTALVFGMLAMRTRGAYLLMITLALSQLIWGIAVGWRSLTGSSDGLPNVPRPDLMPLVSLDNEISFYYFVLIAVSLAGLLMAQIVASPFGYALRGIRESESRMLALGYDVKKFRLTVFVMSAVFAALAGVLYVYFNRFVSPDFLHVQRSAEVLLMVILGGAGTLIGPVVGAAAIVTLENVAGEFTERWVMILGFVYIVVALFAPEGLVGLFKRVVNGRAVP